MTRLTQAADTAVTFLFEQTAHVVGALAAVGPFMALAIAFFTHHGS